MVKLSKLYTRGGDDGETGLIGGKRVKKTNPQVEAYGNLDELNSWLGIMRAALRDKQVNRFEDELFEVQQVLFDIGAELATPEDSDWQPPSIVLIDDISKLEESIDKWTGQVDELKSFLLPGGSKLTSYCHIARSVCRRTERSVIELVETSPVRGEVLQYINRLSDWLFALARIVAKEIGEEESLWDPSRAKSE